MAHGDYNCCAVCDCKLDFNASDPRTKKEICTDCLHTLKDNGLNVLNPDELIKWIETADEEVLKDTLDKIGFSFCYYSNPVDDAVLKRSGRRD